MKEIRRQIAERSFYKVYLLTGDETYLILQAKQLLKQAMVSDGDEMNYRLFEDNKVNLEELRDLSQTFPFFSEKRVLILDRTGILKDGKDAFVKILEQLPDTTCIIICEPEVDKRSRAYKWIKKNGCIREFLKKNQTEKDMTRWLAALLKKDGRKIRESDALYFLEQVGDDMFQIKNEAEKLISYLGERDTVAREDIDAIVSSEVMNKIFDLITAIAMGDKQQALSCYDDLIVLREPPMRILFLIIRQYRILLLICNMRDLHKTGDDIARAAGIPKFALRRNESQLRGYDIDSLERCIETCVQIEEEIKTGRINERIGVEWLIVGLSEKKAETIC